MTRVLLYMRREFCLVGGTSLPRNENIMVDKKAAKKPAKQAEGGEATKKSAKPKVEKFGRGKKYLQAAAKIDPAQVYGIDEAIALIKDSSPVKFDATVELHAQMGLDPKKSEQNIRGTVTLPAGSGKTVKILVLAEEADAAKAKAAGADFVGLDDMIEKVSEGWLGFDLVIATPATMAKVGKLGQTLGTKGLMPNPKSGTVTTDPAKAVDEFKKGKVEFRLDKDAIIHMGIGKVSFGASDLKSNFDAVLAAIRAAKPATAKGTYMKKLSLASTMGPGVKVDIQSI